MLVNNFENQRKILQHIKNLEYKISCMYCAEQGAGTVSSVGLDSDSEALTITNSPITTSGTIGINFNGTPDEVVGGDGSLIPISSLGSQNLQSVTTGTGNNLTTNALQVAGIGEADLTEVSTIMYHYTPTVNGGGVGLIDGTQLRRVVEASIDNGETILYNDIHSQTLLLREQTGSDSGALFSGRVSAQPAINGTDLVTLDQVVTQVVTIDTPPLTGFTANFNDTMNDQFMYINNDDTLTDLTIQVPTTNSVIGQTLKIYAIEAVNATTFTGITLIPAITGIPMGGMLTLTRIDATSWVVTVYTPPA